MSSSLEAEISPFDRLPPHSLEMEMCLLASMMLDREMIGRVISIVRREMFYRADHQIIFDVLLGLYRDNKPVDALILREELIRRGLYEECGGREYLAEILGKIPSAAHGCHYAGVVREKAILRGCIAASNEVLRSCYAPALHERAIEIAQTASRDYASLASTGTADKVHRLGDAVAEVYEDLQQKRAQRVQTGLCDLDEMCGGFACGTFTLIGGRPGMGKSQLIKQVLRNAAERGIATGIVTVEENRHKVAENALSAASGIENSRIAHGTCCREEYEELAGAVNRLSRLPMFIMDDPVKLGEVEAAITLLALEHKCKMVAVDYLQLIDPGIGESENREVSKVSQSLKWTFKRLHIAGVAAVQLNRSNEMHGIQRPTLRSLRGSGSLEQDGDLIILLHRDDYYKREEDGYQPDHKLEAIIAKQKSGPSGALPLWFSGKTQTVWNWNNGWGPANAVEGAA